MKAKHIPIRALSIRSEFILGVENKRTHPNSAGLSASIASIGLIRVMTGTKEFIEIRDIVIEEQIYSHAPEKNP